MFFFYQPGFHGRRNHRCHHLVFDRKMYTPENGHHAVTVQRCKLCSVLTYSRPLAFRIVTKLFENVRVAVGVHCSILFPPRTWDTAHFPVVTVLFSQFQRHVSMFVVVVVRLEHSQSFIDSFDNHGLATSQTN